MWNEALQILKVNQAPVLLGIKSQEDEQSSHKEETAALLVQLPLVCNMQTTKDRQLLCKPKVSAKHNAETICMLNFQWSTFYLFMSHAEKQNNPKIVNVAHNKSLVVDQAHSIPFSSYI